MKNLTCSEILPLTLVWGTETLRMNIITIMSLSQWEWEVLPTGHSACTNEEELKSRID